MTTPKPPPPSLQPSQQPEEPRRRRVRQLICNIRVRMATGECVVSGLGRVQPSGHDQCSNGSSIWSPARNGPSRLGRLPG